MINEKMRSTVLDLKVQILRPDHEFVTVDGRSPSPSTVSGFAVHPPSTTVVTTTVATVHLSPLPSPLSLPWPPPKHLFNHPAPGASCPPVLHAWPMSCPALRVFSLPRSATQQSTGLRLIHFVRRCMPSASHPLLLRLQRPYTSARLLGILPWRLSGSCDGSHVDPLVKPFVHRLRLASSCSCQIQTRQPHHPRRLARPW